MDKGVRLSCEEIVKHICGELDEHINSPQCRTIKKHIKSCPHCSAYLDSLKKTVRFYRIYESPKLTSKCRTELYKMLNLKTQHSRP